MGATWRCEVARMGLAKKLDTELTGSCLGFDKPQPWDVGCMMFAWVLDRILLGDWFFEQEVDFSDRSFLKILFSHLRPF